MRAFRAPFRVRPSAIALVFLGGSGGTALRAGLSSGLPVHTLIINVAGSLLLGILLEHLARRGAGPAGDRLRLLLGTGLLGGFTTYSALSVDTAQLLLAGQTGTALLYGLGTVLLGLLAAGTGVALSAAIGRSDDAGGATS